METTTCDCSIRSLGPADEELLREFFYSHSRETVYRRFGYVATEISRTKSHALVHVDQEKNVALGLFERDNSAERLDAVARYSTKSDGRTAEMSVLVRESMQRRGFGSLILHDLAEVAEGRGITQFHAQVLRTNFALRQLYNRYGPKISSFAGEDSAEYLISVCAILKREVAQPLGTEGTEFKVQGSTFKVAISAP